jgi:hypothetical protein
MQWLLASARDTRRALTEWETSGIACLRCGPLIAAIAVPVALVDALSPRPDPAVTHTYLAESLHEAPVFRCQNGEHFYVLVDPGTPDARVPDVEWISHGHQLGVPHPSLTAYPGRTGSYWAVPMALPGKLGSASAVSQLLAYGRYRVAQMEVTS